MYNRVSFRRGYSIVYESIGPVKIIIHVHVYTIGFHLEEGIQ